MKNLNKTGQDNLANLIKLLQSVLSSKGKQSRIDTNGNVTYVDCDIFAEETLTNFLELSLSNFNSIPNFTNYTLEDVFFVKRFSAILVEGATLYALSSQALIERGREFAIECNGIVCDPPNLSDMLNTQYATLLHVYHDKLKLIKTHLERMEP